MRHPIAHNPAIDGGGGLVAHDDAPAGTPTKASVDAGHWGSEGAVEAWHAAEALRSQQFGPATERMLDLAGIGPGSRVLDLACGTGEQTVLAAQRVGPTGSVHATDIAPGMVAATAETTQAAGLGMVTTQVLDAREATFAPSAFDAVICRNGLQWMPQPWEVLAAVRVALRPGGRAVVLVHGRPERNVAVVVPALVLRRVGGLPAPSPEEPDNCALGEPGLLEATFRRAGFTTCWVEPVLIPRSFATAASATAAIRAGSGYLRSLTAQLPPARQEPAWQEIEAALATRATPEGLDLSSESLLGIGVA